jgi:uncharacterized protein YkwD
MALPRSPYRLAIAVSLTLLAAIAALVLPTPSHAATAPCAASDVAASNAPASGVGRAIRCLVNGERAARGLAPLRASRQLRVAAESHGADMVSHRFFAHVSPLAGAITDRARSAGYLSRATDGYVLGEDIAWGEGELSTPAAIVTAWMNSPPHRAVILDRDFRDVGVGVVEGVPVESSLGGATFVLDVGAK